MSLPQTMSQPEASKCEKHNWIYYDNSPCAFCVQEKEDAESPSILYVLKRKSIGLAFQEVIQVATKEQAIEVAQHYLGAVNVLGVVIVKKSELKDSYNRPRFTFPGGFRLPDPEE
jgi:Ni,Fe-hydrogenase I small subunit